MSEETKVKEWNMKYPIGTDVELTDDFGIKHKRQTSSEAWLLGGHTAVVKVKDSPAAYLLDRIKAREVRED